MLKSKFSLTLALVAVVALSGCDLATNYTKMDREGDLEMQDYRDAMASRVADTREEDPGIVDNEAPELMPYVAPLSDDLQAMPLVSISINQSVPLRDALFELADQAGYDIELDPNIRGSIIFTAREKPFDLVIKRIAEVAGLRYKFEDGILRVEEDSPYNKSYKIDYLNIVRTNASSVSTNVSVVTGEGADTGSNFTAETSSESNFWEELDTNLAQILNVEGSENYLRTRRDPRLNVVNNTQAPVAQTQVAQGGGTVDADPGTVDPSVAGADAGQPPAAQAPQATLQVNSLPADAEDEEMNNRRGREAAGPSFAINRQAGLILVHASERKHKEVQEYLQRVRRAVTTQVLIEAKVLEVSLNDQFSAGIDWRAFDLLGDSLGFQSGDVADGVLTNVRPGFDTPTSPPTEVFFSTISDDISLAAEAVSRFGTVKSLASPRLTVLNNQSAALNVADNLVYFEIEIDSNTTEFGTETEIESDIKNVPEGVLINVQPSIDYETGQIAMSIRPTITRVEEFVNDPGVAFAAQQADIEGIQSLIPVVNVQEIDTVINMQSGDAVIMGGLMQDRAESTQQGVPVLSEIPLAGTLFRNQVDEVNKTELVIFLKATIIENNNVHNTDKDLYRMFSGDRRPLDL